VGLDLPWPVVLASASPRRQELLRRIVPAFEVDPADVDEDALTVADPFETAESLARAKARRVAERHPGALVIGGDTVVAVPGDGWLQLSKPRDEEDALRILQRLQGRSHVVATGISLQAPGVDRTFHERTTVVFREVSEDEIRRYIATGEPMDKAGAYGAQGMAATFVDHLEGSRDNVIGLPVERLEQELRAILQDLGKVVLS
jgi:septum formation protein